MSDNLLNDWTRSRRAAALQGKLAQPGQNPLTEAPTGAHSQAHRTARAGQDQLGRLTHEQWVEANPKLAGLAAGADAFLGGEPGPYDTPLEQRARTGSPNMIPHWDSQSARFMEQIDIHLSKTDFTVIDLTNFPQHIIDDVNADLGTLSQQDLDRIIRVGF